jgi:hypothetical protein
MSPDAVPRSAEGTWVNLRSSNGASQTQKKCGSEYHHDIATNLSLPRKTCLCKPKETVVTVNFNGDWTARQLCHREVATRTKRIKTEYIKRYQKLPVF